MRSLVALVLLSCILAILSASSFTLAQKSVCTPIATSNSTIDPNQIPVSTLSLSNRGQGPSVEVVVSLCSPITPRSTAYPQCVGEPGFIVVNGAPNATSPCTGVFNKVIGRPTVSGSGFTTIYGSTLNGNDNNQVSLTVICAPKASAALVSRSGKYAVMKNTKTGGFSYMVIVYSSVACGSTPLPPPPTPGTDASCRPFVLGRTLINPVSWAPAVLELAQGWSAPQNLAFSLCDGTGANLPTWLPDCPTASFITRYFLSNSSCGPASFNKMVKFSPETDHLSIVYTSTVPQQKMNVTSYAIVKVYCGNERKGLYSPSGEFTHQVRNGMIITNFTLAHPAMCVQLPTTRPPLTKPTMPTMPTFPTRPTMPTLPPHTKPNVTGQPSFTKPSFPVDPTRPPMTKPAWSTKPSGSDVPPMTRPTGSEQPPFTKPSFPVDPTRPPMTKPAWSTKPSGSDVPPPLTKPSNPVGPTDGPLPTKPSFA